MSVPYLLTAGPTEVNPRVLAALGARAANPDLDLGFYELYKSVCDRLKKLLKTENEVYILGGEGMVGLEAACASLTEVGDRVLIIDNGIFGAGFEPLVNMYGGETVVFKSEYDRPIDVNALKAFLERDHNFKYATVVHCETPSGVTNPVDKICPMLKAYGIASVVDSVSGIGGEELNVDKIKADIVLGGSQKCLSAPAGLAFASISRDAFKIMEGRKTKIASFYSNFYEFKDWYENKWFPYTMPIHLINALSEAIDVLFEKGDYAELHRKTAQAVRGAVKAAGLEIYAKGGFSNTVTAVMLPEGVDFKAVQEYILKKADIMVGSSLGYLENRVMRIGHMGEGCKCEKLELMFKAFDEALKAQGFKTLASMDEVFRKELNSERN